MLAIPHRLACSQMSLRIGTTTTNCLKTIQIIAKGHGQRILQNISSVDMTSVPKARTSRKYLPIDIRICI